MVLTFATLSVLAVGLSILLTGAVLRFVRLHGVIDAPNERSSHTIATPRGGGLALVVVTTLASVLLGVTGSVDAKMLIAVIGGGVAVAVTGFLDDRTSLPAGIRLAVHLAAACWAVFWLGGAPALEVAGRTIDPGWLGQIVVVLAITWTLNLFNFMDGIDGIAASEAIFVACGAAAIMLFQGSPTSVPQLGLVLGAACMGFLFWNWPPAKIFMGDVGSGFIGYVIAVLAFGAQRGDPTAVWVWLILGGVFFVDATVTLVRRLIRGDRVQDAHRTHGYQWLARCWGSHRRVTVAVLALNLLWLFPCACVAASYPHQADWIALGSLTPLVGLSLAVGSGRAEVTAIPP
jgi:Fuc2NAc and GlcNAc transferase